MMMPHSSSQTSLSSTVASSSDVSSTISSSSFDTASSSSVDGDVLSLLEQTRQQTIHPLKSLASALEVDHLDIFNHQRQTKPIVCGHRGSVYRSLENTRHAFQTAHQIGCDEIEIDVFLLKCGTLCVFHGSGTDQLPGLFDNYCTTMSGSILDYTYDEIINEDNFQFNPHYEEFGCGPEMIAFLEKEEQCYVPKLEDVLLDAKQNGIIVKIELKGENTAQATLELVEKLDMVHQCHFSSFDLSRVRIIRELRPHRCPLSGKHIYKTGALFDEVPDNFIQLALDVGASEVHLKYSRCTKSRVDKIHEAGMDSMFWSRGPIGMNHDIMSEYCDIGNEDEMMFRVMMATGVRKMCVNKPDVLIKMLNQ